MRAGRATVCLTGVVGLLAMVPVVHRSPLATYGGADPRLRALEVAASMSLLTVAVMGPPRVAAVLVALTGALWLVPEIGGAAGLPSAATTVAEALEPVLVATLLAALVLRAGPVSSGMVNPLVLAAIGSATAVLARVFLVDPFDDAACWRTCDHNPLLVGDWAWGVAIEQGARLALGAGVVWAALLVPTGHGRARTVGSGSRADLAGWLLLGLLVLEPWVRPGAVASVTDDVWAVVCFVATQVSAVAWLALLAQESWSRWRLEQRLAHLVDLLGSRSDPEALATSLRRAARNPSLRLAYWAPSRQVYVDADGQAVPFADPQPGELVTTISRRGCTIAVLVHSSRVNGPRLERALGPAIRLALENAQLRAAALAELDELTRSRARVVERGAVERRRLERNLHDGAQQRAVSLALLVRVFTGSATPADLEAGRRAEALTRTLVEELRRVARGIYPAVLADAGLAGALVDLAERSEDLPVVVLPLPECRFPGTIETTAYLVVRAGLGDARNRGATSTVVTGRQVGGSLLVRVEDDAVAPGRVPTELVDQVAALGGTVSLDGVPGRRRVEAVLPCGS